MGVAGLGIEDDELLRIAGGVESDSEHPLARAIVAAARDRGTVATATDFRSITGRGVEASVDGERSAVAGPDLHRARSTDQPAPPVDWEKARGERGAPLPSPPRGQPN